MKPVRIFALVLALATGGCSFLERIMVPPGGDMTKPGPVVPDKTINLSPLVQLPLESVVYWSIYASIAYMILDPLAPNWEIKEAAFPDNHVLVDLKMKRFYTGGAGEARQMFQHRAGELMRSGGFTGFRIIEYSEGLNSSMLGAQRTARGIIQLTHKDG